MIKIIEKNVDELIPYDNNARINDKAVEAVAKSIKEFGMKNPIIIDKNNTIIAGHTRLKALKSLGVNIAPCIVADDLTNEQIKAFRIADNSTSQIADWDLDKLNEELKSIDYDMAEFGLAEQIKEIEQEFAKEVIEDEVPEVDENNTITKLGDIWQLGRHRLMCGDSTDNLTVEKLMDGNKADMLFTDPPYGIKYQSNMRTESNKFKVLKNDDKILNFLPILKDKCKGYIFICTTWKVLNKWLPLFSEYYNLSNMIIWDKGGGGIGDLEHTFSTDYEIILCSNNNAKITGKRIGSVWKVSKDSANKYIHATQKPVGLSVIAIENTTDRNNLVIDLFGGSGSTLIACEQLNRTCYMMELDPKYVQVIIQRYIAFKGTSDDVYRINADGTKTKHEDIT